MDHTFAPVGLIEVNPGSRRGARSTATRANRRGYLSAGLQVLALERLQSMRVRAVVVPACLRGALLELVGAPSCRRAVSANPLQIPKHFRIAVSQPIRRETTLREALVQKVGRGVILSRQRMKLGYRKIQIPRDLLEFPVIETRFAGANEFGCDGFYPPDQGAGPRCSLHAFGNDHWNTSLSAHPIRANTDHLGVDLDQKGSVRYTALLKRAGGRIGCTERYLQSGVTPDDTVRTAPSSCR